jgi:hypothetical protein
LKPGEPVHLYCYQTGVSEYLRESQQFTNQSKYHFWGRLKESQSGLFLGFLASNRTTVRRARQQSSMPPGQESRNMAISAEYLNLTQSDLVTEPSQYALLHRLIDEGAVYIAQALTASQFATLSALLHRLVSPAQTEAETTDLSGRRFCAYPLGLEELDTLARTHAGYAFIELPYELQDAMLDLIAAGDLSTGRIDLAAWLTELRSTAAPRRRVA